MNAARWLTRAVLYAVALAVGPLVIAALVLIAAAAVVLASNPDPLLGINGGAQ